MAFLPSKGSIRSNSPVPYAKSTKMAISNFALFTCSSVMSFFCPRAFVYPVVPLKTVFCMLLPITEISCEVLLGAAFFIVITKGVP